MPSVKYEDHPFLPASVPKDQAHILQNTIEKEVDEDGVAASDGHLLCDFIATFLYNLENYPDAPKDFFDPDVKSFTINRKVVEGKTSHLQTFLILRKKNRVVVSPTCRRVSCPILIFTTVRLLRVPRRSRENDRLGIRNEVQTLRGRA